jgi:hypothetical protein
MSSETDSLSTLATAAATVVLVVLLQQYFNVDNGNLTGNRGRIPGSKTFVRNRPTIPDLFKEYGPINFRRAYRMKEESFWVLLDLLEKEMGGKTARR